MAKEVDDTTAGTGEDAGVLGSIVSAAFEPKTVLKRGAFWLVRLYRSSPQAFSLVVAALLGLGVLTRLLGLDILYMIPPAFALDASPSLPILRDASWVQEAYSDEPCLARAKALSKPYVLRNVTQWIRYAGANSMDEIRVQERIIYDLVPLRSIKKNDETFLEEFSSSNKEIHHWYGPHRELFVGGNSKYQVEFEAKHGRSLMVTTGAELQYALPLADGRSAFRQQATLNHDEDFWVYQNIEDVICRLTQIIESESLVLVPIGRGGRRVGNNKSVEGDVYYQQLDPSEQLNSSLGMSWENLEPGEDAGVLFKWRQRQKRQP